MHKTPFIDYFSLSACVRRSYTHQLIWLAKGVRHRDCLKTYSEMQANRFRTDEETKTKLSKVWKSINCANHLQCINSFEATMTFLFDAVIYGNTQKAKMWHSFIAIAHADNIFDEPIDSLEIDSGCLFENNKFNLRRWHFPNTRRNAFAFFIRDFRWSKNMNFEKKYFILKWIEAVTMISKAIASMEFL